MSVNICPRASSNYLFDRTSAAKLRSRKHCCRRSLLHPSRKDRLQRLFLAGQLAHSLCLRLSWSMSWVLTKHWCSKGHSGAAACSCLYCTSSAGWKTAMCQDQCRLCLVNALMSTKRLYKIQQQRSAARRTSGQDPLRPQRSSDFQVSSV